MKKIAYLFFLGFTFLSCKKSSSYKQQELQIKMIESEEGIRGTRYVFKYDAENRLISLNDTLYFYNANGKIAWSRYHKEENTNGYRYLKVIRKNYQWDEKLRIKEIYIDSLYESITSPTGDFLSNGPSSRIEAKFFYTGLDTQPDSIQKDFLVDGRPQNIEHITYVNNNIVKKGKRANLLSYNVPGYTNKLVGIENYEYTDVSHYLYELYKKIGFLPSGLGYVASKNAPSKAAITSYIYLNELNGQEKIDRVELESKYNYTKGRNNQVSIMHAFGRVDYGLGFTSWNDKPVNTYIYY